MEIERSQCVICDKLLASFDNNIREISGAYSSTPLVELLEKLLGELLPASKQCCCDECIKKLNDYDLASQTALNIENDLFDMYHSKNVEYYVDEASESSLPPPPPQPLEDDLLMEVIDEDDVVSVKEEGDTLVEYLYEVDDELSGSVTAEDAATPPPLPPPEMKERGRRKKIANNDDDETAKRVEHMKTRRTKGGMVCDVCGKRYKSKAALDIHVGMHKGISPHECQICGKKFTQKGALVRHMPLHTGEHPYQCDKCGKQFIHYSSFHMHQLAHYDIRLKKCDICGLKLRSNSHLTRHLRVHSGEKPHECPTCGQKFAQRYNMNTHLRGHQGIHRVQSKKKCTICTASFTKLAMLNEHMASMHSTTAPTTKVDNDLSRAAKKPRKINAKSVKVDLIDIKNKNV